MTSEQFRLPELIVWRDSMGLPGGWEAADALVSRPLKVYSLGFVVAEDAHYLTIVPHVGVVDCTPNQVGGAITIPKSAIVGRDPLNAIYSFALACVSADAATDFCAFFRVSS